jgi:hypothetical protein
MKVYVVLYSSGEWDGVYNYFSGVYGTRNSAEVRVAELETDPDNPIRDCESYDIVEVEIETPINPS